MITKNQAAQIKNYARDWFLNALHNSPYERITEAEKRLDNYLINLIEVTQDDLLSHLARSRST